MDLMYETFGKFTKLLYLSSNIQIKSVFIQSTKLITRNLKYAKYLVDYEILNFVEFIKRIFFNSYVKINKIRNQYKSITLSGASYKRFNVPVSIRFNTFNFIII